MTDAKSAVVLFDPSGEEPEGEVLSGHRLAAARSRGVEALPVDVTLLRSGALSGYARRCYGRGWRYDANQSGRGCPLVLYASTQYPEIHWLVRLIPDPELHQRAGHLRVAVDTAQAGAQAAGLSPRGSPLNAGTLGDPDAAGGWSWRGESHVTLVGDQLLGLQLYGALSGLRVAWWAVSQG